MLSREGSVARRQRLWDRLPDCIEWVLIADPRHVYYFGNFWIRPLSFSAGERALLLLEKDGSATLIADNFVRRSGDGVPAVDREVIETWYDHRHSVVNRDHALLAAWDRVAQRLSGRPGIVEAEWLPQRASAVCRDHSTDKSIELGTLIRQLRRQKEADELDLLKRSVQAGEAGHVRARKVVRAGISELDVYYEVQAAVQAAAGVNALIYGDFRAVNAQSPKRGGPPTDYVLQEGDLLILDYSVVLDGYRSDLTNTICVGEPTRDQKSMFSACQAAMACGEGLLQAHRAATDVFVAISQSLDDAGFGPLVHHAGHGIGLDHPEPPILAPYSDDTLLAGDVVTLEPGLYIDGAGGMRFEHNYLITETGFERLSHHVLALE